MKTRPLKICMITESFFPSVGGQENFVHGLATELTKRGHDIHVIAPKYNDRLVKNAGINQNNFCPIYKVRRPYSLPLGVLTRFSFFDWRFKFLIWPIFIWFYIKKERFDVIHTHSIFPTATVALVAKLLHIPIVATSHGGDLQVQPNIGYGARLNAVSAALIMFTLKFIEKLVVVSFVLRDLATELGVALKKIVVIPCFIDFDPIKTENSDTIVTELGLEKNNYIFYIGRMTPEKGLLSFVKSIEQSLAHNGPKLVLAGYGHEKQKLQTYVKERNLERQVIFPGLVIGRKKWALFKNSLAFVAPSTTEAFCITAIEAMAAGTVVIARNIPPFSEYIENGITGILLNELKDVPSIIKNLESNPEDRVKIINSALTYVAKNFSLNAVCSKYEEVYAELINR